MKKFFLKIIKEDSQRSDSVELKKQEMSKIILAGDSIAVGVGIWGLKQKGARCCGITTFDNIVPIFPAVRGAQATKWIKTQLINQLNSGKSFTGYKLIIIAGTNDSLGYGLTPSNKIITNAINNIKDMVDTAISKGIKKEDIAIMKIAKYEPSEYNLNAYIKNRQGRGWYPKDKTGEEYKQAQAYFVEKFNAGISSYNTFDMVPVNPDGVHTGSNGSKKLLKRALEALRIKSVDNLEIPTSTLPSSPTIAVNNKLTSKDCHVNQYCKCVDGLVSSEITIVSVQRALKLLGFPIQETGICDNQTRQSIMKFQKQQQEKPEPFVPIHGKDKELGFLRCDACVGINTMAAINKELASAGNKKTIQGLQSSEELVTFRKARKARIRIVGSTSGTGKTLQKVKEIAEEYNLHPDILIMAAVIHSEPSCRRSHCGRWSDEGFGVFNMLINRIQANGPGKGPHHYGRLTSDSLMWNVAVNQGGVMGGQSGGWRPFSTKNFPKDINSSAQKVKNFIKKRIREGSNIGEATFFFHADFQTYQWNLTQKRIAEFGSKSSAMSACISEHQAAGIKYQGMDTKWPRVKPYPNPRNPNKTTTRHPLRIRWRGFAYGDSPDNIRKNWTRKWGPQVTPRIGGDTPEEREIRTKAWNRSQIEPFGDRRAWAKDAFSDSFMNDYLNKLLKDTEEEPVNV